MLEVQESAPTEKKKKKGKMNFVCKVLSQMKAYKAEGDIVSNDTQCGQQNEPCVFSKILHKCST